MKERTVFLTLVAIAALTATAGCSGAKAADDEPAGGTPSGSAGATRSAPRAATRSVTREHVLASGTVLDLRNGSRISSATNHAGDPVSATFATAALASNGDVVIPAGSVLSGSITRIAESGSPGSPGTLQLAFSTLTIGSNTYPIGVTVTSLGTHLDRAGVTTEDAAKVAVGAAVGAVAGRVIGGDKQGARIGAGAGAVGGVIYANRTRDRDIVLLGGAAIVAVLEGSFTRSYAASN